MNQYLLGSQHYNTLEQKVSIPCIWNDPESASLMGLSNSTTDVTDCQLGKLESVHDAQNWHIQFTYIASAKLYKKGKPAVYV